jgi:hypothetical protein
MDRIRASMPNIDAKLLDSPAARYATLERLVRERVLAEAADKLHLTTSDARWRANCSRTRPLHRCAAPTASSTWSVIASLAASQGLTPEGFEARVRRDLSLRQVEAGVLGTEVSTPVIADVTLGALFEKREIQVARFATADFTAKVSPSEADIEAYYKANPKQFQASESVNIEYVVLDLDAIKQSITVNEADLKTYYDQNVERLSGKEERRASHILIASPKDAPAADRAKAKARAEELLAEVRKNPASFADVAKKNSQDPGSAASGGDLDFFSRGAMVKPFEDAVFGMKKGDISDVIESDFGYHVITLTDVKSPKARSFEELRPGIEVRSQDPAGTAQVCRSSRGLHQRCLRAVGQPQAGGRSAQAHDQDRHRRGTHARHGCQRSVGQREVPECPVRRRCGAEEAQYRGRRVRTEPDGVGPGGVVCTGPHLAAGRSAGLGSPEAGGHACGRACAQGGRGTAWPRGRQTPPRLPQ